MKTKIHLWVTLLAAGMTSLWLGRYQSPPVVLAGFMLLFVVIRGFSWDDFIALSLGAMVGFFILPVSLLGALGGFAAVQILHEIRKEGPARDRFRDGLRTARRVLDGLT